MFYGAMIVVLLFIVWYKIATVTFGGKSEPEM